MNAIPAVVITNPSKPNNLITTLLDNKSGRTEDNEYYEADLTSRLQLVTEHSSVTLDFSIDGLMDVTTGEDLTWDSVLVRIQKTQSEIINFHEAVTEFLTKTLDAIAEVEAEVNSFVTRDETSGAA